MFGDHRRHQTLAEMCRNMGICYGFRSMAARVKYPGFMKLCRNCRGPNASNPARGRTLPGQERPSNGRPDASQRRPGSMLCPVGLPGALSVDILALLLYWPTYAPITVRLTSDTHVAYWHIKKYTNSNTDSCRSPHPAVRHIISNSQATQVSFVSCNHNWMRVCPGSPLGT